MTKTKKQPVAKPVTLWAVVIMPKKGAPWIANEMHFTRRDTKEAYIGDHGPWSRTAEREYGKTWTVKKVEVREL